MKELHWTPQQPIERAVQRDETEIPKRRTKTWIEICEKAVLEQRILLFVDESGFYLLPAILKTYAPRGETPILKVFQTRDHLSVMSGITPQGREKIENLSALALSTVRSTMKADSPMVKES